MRKSHKLLAVLSLLGIVLLGGGNLFAQNRTCQGTVKDAKGEPVHVLTDAELTELGYARFGSTWAVDGDYRNECLHEGLGHGFTRLMDEYWYGDKVFPDCTYGNVIQ